ncbi:MAG: PTS sugar transporter subunit IIA [Myxococcales bacterium]|nr:PTS sugar transporter subunit IIA [Myxococcales bacterium]
MTARQLAGYLNVNERTVLKLVQEGAIPGVKVGSQWRFRKAMIDTWLDDQALGVTPRYVDASRPTAPGRVLTLASCFAPTHVIPELVGKTKSAVLVELAGLAARLGLVRDETWFVGALIQRENVMPSALGHGVAFLHTLRRSPEQVLAPFMLLGRSREGIDFDALDGQPTHLFFVLGLKYDELHLPWLAKLVHMLLQPNAVGRLLDAPDAGAIHQELLEAERLLAPRGAVESSEVGSP